VSRALFGNNFRIRNRRNQATEPRPSNFKFFNGVGVFSGLGIRCHVFVLIYSRWLLAKPSDQSALSFGGDFSTILFEAKTRPKSLLADSISALPAG